MSEFYFSDMTVLARVFMCLMTAKTVYCLFVILWGEQ